MGKLLGEDEQLAMRNFQVARGTFRLRGARRYDLRLGAEHFNSNGNALLHFNLPDRDCSICAIEHTFNQSALRVAGTIRKLWHRRGKSSETENPKLESRFAKLNGAM